MKCYVVVHEHTYESYSVIAVFMDRGLAEEFCKSVKRNDYDYWPVEHSIFIREVDFHQ